jgi:hypothetical protein
MSASAFLLHYAIWPSQKLIVLQNHLFIAYNYFQLRAQRTGAHDSSSSLH